jgi:putative membrane-bound dehydrogenase-like protein
VAVPDLIRFEDTKGTGKADKREVIFTGLQSEAPRLNVQALPNNFQWGPDNLIHLQMSLGGRSRIHRPNDKGEAKVVSGDLYFDPKTYAWGMEAGGGQYGMSYDNYGRRFTCSNSDHLQFYVYDSRDAANFPGMRSPRASIAADGPAAEVYRISPDEPWRIIRTRWRVSGAVKGVVEGGGRVSGYFTGATGTTVYRGDAYGPDYVNDTFTGDAGGGLVHHKRIKADGVSLIGARPAGEEKIEFAASRDTWFRPVDFANAPDGTLYIIDMYREVIEHPWSIPEQIKQYIDLTSGRDRGRIYRLAPDGFKPKPPPQLGKATTSELVAALGSTNGWTRDTATRLLWERGDSSARPWLDKLLTSSPSPLARLHALRVLASVAAGHGAPVLAALNDKDENVRAFAVHLAAQPEVDASDKNGHLKAIWKRLMEMAQTEHSPRVQLQLLFTLGGQPSNDRAHGIASIARRSASDPWIGSAILSAPDSAAIFTELASDESFRKKPEAQTLLAGLAKAVGAAHDPAVLGRVLDIVTGDEPNYAILAGLAEGAATAKTSLTQAAGAKSNLVASAILKAREAAVDAHSQGTSAAAAVSLLGFDDPQKAVPILISLTDARRPAAIRSAALTSLGHFAGNKEIAPNLLARWKTYDAAGRIEITRFLAAREAWAKQLLEAVQKGEIPAADIGATEARLLQSSKHQEIAALADKLLPKPSTATRDEVIKQFEPALSLTGDKAKGHETFMQRCSICHRLRGEGNAFGPDLESVVAGGKEKILTHLIDPNREVAPQFAAYTVEMKDGSALAGIVAAETPAQVTFREPLGKETILPREAIARLQTTGRSPMPEGLEAGLTHQDMANLLAFLTGN